MFDFDEAVEIALRTWYPKDHELHMKSYHPLGKLLGGFGKLLDDYMKSIYNKPGYVFEPLDELGDIWYYFRILCYQNKMSQLQPLSRIVFSELGWSINVSSGDISRLIGTVMYRIVEAFVTDEPLDLFNFRCIYSVIKEIAKCYNITLQQLTDSNWEKLIMSAAK